MLLKISDIDSWKNFFDLIHDTTTVVEMKLDQEKCEMSLLNNSHVCFYMAEYDYDFFDEYIVEDVESVLLFVADFYDIIKTANKKDTIELSTDEASLKIVLEHDLNRRVFEIPLADDYRDSPNPPDIPVTISFEVDLKELKQPCMDLDKIVKTDRFKMIIEDDILNVVSPDDSMTKYKQEIIINNEGSASTVVNLGYVLDLQKLSKINDVVKFGVSNDMPLTWDIISVDECVKVKGLIAPIIESED